MTPTVTADPSDAASAEPAKLPDFQTLYDENFSFVWRTVRRMGTPASRLDDVVQDVFVSVAQRLGSYDPARGHVRSWIYGISVHVIQNERRRHRRKDQPFLPLSSDDETSLDARLPSPDRGPHQQAEAQEAMRIANELLASIPEERREILILADLEEMPVVEIAESLGLNLNTAHARLRTARREFDEALARRHAQWRRTER